MSSLTRYKKTKRAVIFSLLAASLIILSCLSLKIGPEEIVNRIGIRNGYFIAFAVSFFAGFSAFTAVPFYSMLITFISGGLNPVLLTLIAGASLSLGDMFLFYFGKKGREIISGKLDNVINHMADFFERRHLQQYIPIFSYIYISVIPLPNDWLLLFLASIRYPQKIMNAIIILGDFTHTSLLIFLITKGIIVFA